MDAAARLDADERFPQEPLPLESLLCFALSAASRTLTAAYREELDPLELTYPQFLVVVALLREDGLSMGELAEMLCLDASTLTPLIRRLESRGLVTRARSAEDERRVLLHLTPAGRDLSGPIGEVQRSVASQIPLTLDEAVTLRDLSQRLVGVSS